MDYVKLKQEITSRNLGALSPQVCAAALNAITVTVIQETWINERTLYAQLGPAMGEDILARLDAAAASNSVIARTRAWLRPGEGGVDVGHISTRAQLDGLTAAGVLTAPQVAALKGLAERSVPLHATYDGAPFTAEDVFNAARAT